MVAGVGVGLAFCGLNVFALGPGALVAGIVLCADGWNLSKKAADNLKQAHQIQEDVDRIIKYYDNLSDSSVKLQQATNNLNSLFKAHLDEIAVLLHTKTEWSAFSKKERKLVENAVLICKMLYKMCGIELAVRTAEIETVNTPAIEEAVKGAERLIGQVNRKTLLGLPI